MYRKVSISFAGRELALEVGKVARQAHGSVLVSYGDNKVLVTAVASSEQREGVDFIPLTVNYQDKFYASGKIPGGFFKREGRPTEAETLNCRLIDRPLRPLFPKGWNFETQIMPTVLSADQEANTGVLALIGASAALELSDIPFLGPIAAVAVGRVDGQFIINPSRSQLEQSDIDLVVAGNSEGVIMVEGGARMALEEDILDAVFFAHEQIQPVLELQNKLREQMGVPKREFQPAEIDEDLKQKITSRAQPVMEEALNCQEKLERHRRINDLWSELKAEFEADEALAGRTDEARVILSEMERELVRQRLIEAGERIDHRRFDEVRPVTCEVGLLPRCHGSALFTRGETQAIVVTTLGTREDEKLIEHLDEEYFKTFYLHYNFPPFSVGETSFRLAPGRREIGHGALAERALARVLPSHDDFPYTIRVVSDILESNGSSSMATVCGASLSLMDAGVPIQAPVAGIAMGLIKEAEGKFHILSDIIGDEDHCGDMDLKVAGTAEGITSVQMDIKISGVTREIMRRALLQAHQGRLHILQVMNQTLAGPRPELSPYAPRVVTMQIPLEKIKDVIGPGGKVIKGIIERTGATIDIDDKGTIRIASINGEANDKVIRIIRELTQEAEVGAVYNGKVKKITDFGAFVEIFPGTDGLVHISQLENYRVRRVTDVLREGDEVVVKCIGVDQDGKISLSRKAVLDLQPNKKERSR
jgi:polyribonucleotide nucleotidyltransferase